MFSTWTGGDTANAGGNEAPKPSSSPITSLHSLAAKSRQRLNHIISKSVENVDPAKKYGLTVVQAAVIGDPVPPQEWAERRIKRIFIYWMCMIILVAFINATIVYTFFIVPEFEGVLQLRAVFLDPRQYYITSIATVEIVILLTCFYAFYILVFPDENDWKIGDLRWLVFTFLNVFILYCLIMYVRTSIGILDNLEAQMKRDLTPDIHKMPTRFELSHNYFYCCGIKSYKDWKDVQGNGSNPDYPKACCDHDSYPQCKPPLKHHVHVAIPGSKKKRTVTAIYEVGCLRAEVTFILAISGIFFTMISSYLISSTIAVMSMSHVLKFVGMNKDVKVQHANPFFD